MIANRRQPSTITRGRKVAWIVSATIVLPAIAYSLTNSYSIYRPIPFNDAAMGRAAAWVRANRNASHEGAVLLPPGLASVSVTGKAYVTNGIIFFPSWEGRKTLLPSLFETDAGWVEGYGFSIAPLPTMTSEPVGSVKFFRMMNLSDVAHAPGGADGREMAVDSRVERHWYHINSFS